MKNRANRNTYSQMQRFADVTKQLIMMGNIGRAKQCMNIAENIFRTGNSEIKNAITNVYIYSVSTFLELHKCSIRNLFPEFLKSEYQKQVRASGI
ncbi:MAG: hypothetical protein IPK08_18035 [Bacteroidetes bacterium]|nr:hypothetical protein [Bacteroidota bacterium]